MGWLYDGAHLIQHHVVRYNWVRQFGQAIVGGRG